MRKDNAATMVRNTPGCKAAVCLDSQGGSYVFIITGKLRKFSILLTILIYQNSLPVLY